MSNWLESYLVALDTRDAREKAIEEQIDAYTRLADYAASLHQRHAPQATPPANVSSPAPTFETGRHAIPSSIVGKRPSPPPPLSPDVVALRQDLIVAQRSRSTLAGELTTARAQLSEAQSDYSAATNSLKTIQAQKVTLERKLRDRDSELVEKRKMLERVQDEMLGLEMEANVAAEEKSRVVTENQELVRRLVGEARERERAINPGASGDGTGD